MTVFLALYIASQLNGDVNLNLLCGHQQKVVRKEIMDTSKLNKYKHYQICFTQMLSISLTFLHCTFLPSADDFTVSDAEHNSFEYFQILF